MEIYPGGLLDGWLRNIAFWGPDVLNQLVGQGVAPHFLGHLLAKSVPNPQTVARLDLIPSETSPEERRLLHSFFAKLWRGRAHVLEIGPFLGGTTRAIVTGMLLNPLRQPQAKLHTIDKFSGYYTRDNLAAFISPLVERGVVDEKAVQSLNESASFLEIFNLVHRREDYFSQLLTLEGVLPDRPPERRPLEQPFQLPSDGRYDAVFVDGCKSWYATKAFMQQACPRTPPGSHYIFQDYGWYTCFWIAVFLFVFKEHFQLLAHIDNTYCFELVKPLSAAEIERSFPDEPKRFGADWYRNAFAILQRQAADRGDVNCMLTHSLHCAAALAYLGHKDEAKALIEAQLRIPYFEKYRGKARAALASPTYTPDGPISL